VNVRVDATGQNEFAFAINYVGIFFRQLPD